VFITAVPITKLFAWGEGVWTSLPISTDAVPVIKLCVCLLLQLLFFTIGDAMGFRFFFLRK
jgi:hypothetical protein